MIQRVGIAQALLNDPEVVFLDEPMSGLDPLGRRDVRSLILELRDQGRTVFFSSHILADAEAMCSRVAVVAGGRLAAAGRVSDILAFQLHGWELVMDNLQPEVLARIARQLTRSSEISPGRYALDLPLDRPPERLLTELTATGAVLVSLESAPRHARGFLRASRRRDRRRRARRTPGRSSCERLARSR